MTGEISRSAADSSHGIKGALRGSNQETSKETERFPLFEPKLQRQFQRLERMLKDSGRSCSIEILGATHNYSAGQKIIEKARAAQMLISSKRISHKEILNSKGTLLEILCAATKALLDDYVYGLPGAHLGNKDYIPTLQFVYELNDFVLDASKRSAGINKRDDAARIDYTKPQHTHAP